MMTSGLFVGFTMASATLAAACFNPAPLGSCSAPCPEGFVCSPQGVCVAAEVPPDVPIDVPGDVPIDVSSDAPLDAPAGWSLVQTAGADSRMNTSLSVTPLGAGHLIVVAVLVLGNESVTITDDSRCNSYVPIPNGRAACHTFVGEMQLFYVERSCAGASRIDVSPVGMFLAAVVWEVSGIRDRDALDTAGVVVDGKGLAPLGPPITTSTDGEFVVSAVAMETKARGIHGGNEFTNDQLTFGNGWAHLTDPHAKAGQHVAQWDQDSDGTYCGAGAAFRAAP